MSLIKANERPNTPTRKYGEHMRVMQKAQGEVTQSQALVLLDPPSPAEPWREESPNEALYSKLA